jgi:membrane protein YdbS with pleckstrin-like domain
MKKLHPGARWLFRLRVYSTLFALVIFFVFFGVMSTIEFVMKEIPSVISTAIILFISLLVLLIILGEIYARMAYNRWLYEIGHDSIRLERGIIWKKYSNIPYERVQNIDIHRGIIARIIGFSSLQVQTAGYSVPVRRGYGAGAEGSIPAVNINEAEKIREYVLKKIKGSKQGL